MKFMRKYALILAILSISGCLYAKSDLEVVKQRVVDEILWAEVDDAEIS